MVIYSFRKQSLYDNRSALLGTAILPGAIVGSSKKLSVATKFSLLSAVQINYKSTKICGDQVQ
jgi:hypothetical protein